jgi:hypothetical protein
LPCCLCICILSTNVARQWYGKHVPLAANTHVKRKELLDAYFSMWSVLYQILSSERKGNDQFFPELLSSILDIVTGL